MQLTVTIDFDLPKDAATLAAMAGLLAAQGFSEQRPVEAPAVEPEAPAAPEAEPKRSPGRPPKTAVAPIPEAHAAEAPPVQAAEAPAPAAEAQPLDLFGENTRHYVEPATIDDVKAALQAYFEKDRAGAIALVRGYGVQQFSQIPPEKFAEFVEKCKAASV